ncbi:hypothetical protein FRX31_032306, partial [Thalictrum thalictroides]
MAQKSLKGGNMAFNVFVKQGAVDREWRQVPSKGNSGAKPTKEKTWAQVVTGSRYDPIREVVDETQAYDMEAEDEAQQNLSVPEVQGDENLSQGPISKKERAKSGTYNSGNPGLRLSRQLWPSSRKLRLGKIKNLARQ